MFPERYTIESKRTFDPGPIDTDVFRSICSAELLIVFPPHTFLNQKTTVHKHACYIFYAVDKV